MGDVTMSVLLSWKPARLTSISDKLNLDRKGLVDLQDELDAGQPPEGWVGADHYSAEQKHKQLAADLVDYVAEVAKVINALDTAAGLISSAKSSLEGAISGAEAAGFSVNRTTGVLTDTEEIDPEDTAAETTRMKLRNSYVQTINDALQDAADADGDLADALRSANSGSIDVDGTLADQSVMSDLRGKTPEEQAKYFLDHPELGAALLETLPVEVRQEIGEQLADRTTLAMDYEDGVDPNDPEGTAAYLSGLNEMIEAYGADEVVATAFLERMGPDGLMELNTWLPTLQLDDDFPDGYDEDRPVHDGLSTAMGDLQRNLGTLLDAGTSGLTGDHQPGSDTHVSSAWVQELVGMGDDTFRLGVSNHYEAHRVFGYQLLAPLLHDADSHYLLTEVGDGMITFETEYAEEHGTIPWGPVYEDGRLVGGRTDGQEWTDHLDGLRLDWTQGTGHDDRAGFDPMGALLDGLSNNPDAARDFLTGPDVPVEFHTGDDESEVRDRSRLNYLLTDRIWEPDHVSWSQVHMNEAYGPSNIAYLGDALQAATMDGSVDAGDRTQVRDILEETVHSLATDEAVHGHDNRHLDDDDTKPFSEMDWIDPALRDPLANILGYHAETLHETMEVRSGEPLGPYGVRWDENELIKVLADIGKDPTANETLREAEYAEAIHQIKSSLPGSGDPSLVTENHARAMASILSSLDYGAVRSDIVESTTADEEHNTSVSDKAGIARELVGFIPTDKIPLGGFVGDKVFEGLIGAWEEANQVDHVGDRNYSTGELLTGRRNMAEDIVRELLRDAGYDADLVNNGVGDAGEAYATEYQWVETVVENEK